MTSTITRRVIYGMFVQVVRLLLLYTGTSLLPTVKFLPEDPLAYSFNYATVAPWSHVLRQLLITTGLLAGGMYIVARSRPDESLRYETVLLWLSRAWMILLIAGVLAGAVDQLEGRHLLALPPVLDVLMIILLAGFLLLTTLSLPGERDHSVNPFVIVWLAGMLLLMICQGIGLIPVTDILQDRILRLLAVNLRLNVAYGLAGIGCAFWLMTRFSQMRSTRTQSGVYTTGGLLTLAGVLVTFAPLYASALQPFVLMGSLSALIAPLFMLIVASHTYPAFAQHNATRTLAAHWVALFIGLLTPAIGVLSAIMSLPGLTALVQGTRLSDLQNSLIGFALIALIAGMMNQAIAEMRGSNARITGLLPFWLMAAGMMGSGLALVLAGVVQVYLERLLSMGYLETQTMLLPLYLAWIIGWLFITAGVIIYAVGFQLRRVKLQ